MMQHIHVHIEVARLQRRDAPNPLKKALSGEKVLATLLVAAALGKRAGNTLMPRAEDDRTASLMQYTDRHPPAAEAVRAAARTALRAAYTRAAEWPFAERSK